MQNLIRVKGLQLSYGAFHVLAGVVQANLWIWQLSCAVVIHWNHTNSYFFVLMAYKKQT